MITQYASHCSLSYHFLIVANVMAWSLTFTPWGLYSYFPPNAFPVSLFLLCVSQLSTSTVCTSASSALLCRFRALSGPSTPTSVVLWPRLSLKPHCCVRQSLAPQHLDSTMATQPKVNEACYTPGLFCHCFLVKPRTDWSVTLLSARHPLNPFRIIIANVPTAPGREGSLERPKWKVKISSLNLYLRGSDWYETEPYEQPFLLKMSSCAICVITFAEKA